MLSQTVFIVFRRRNDQLQMLGVYETHEAATRKAQAIVNDPKTAAEGWKVFVEGYEVQK